MSRLPCLAGRYGESPKSVPWVYRDSGFEIVSLYAQQHRGDGSIGQRHTSDVALGLSGHTLSDRWRGRGDVGTRGKISIDTGLHAVVDWDRLRLETSAVEGKQYELAVYCDVSSLIALAYRTADEVKRARRELAGIVPKKTY